MDHSSSDADADETFPRWAERWLDLGRHTDTALSDEEYLERARALVQMWRSPIPGTWHRGADDDKRLTGPRYQRTHSAGAPKPGGEHELEHGVLEPDPGDVSTWIFGERLVDGVNAVPLVKDAGGGRNGNVEADMLLLTADGPSRRLVVAEVKTQSDHPWFAVVEALRQLRIAMESPAIKSLMARRGHAGIEDSELPMIAAVVAPKPYYSAPGRRGAGTLQAARLAATFMSELDVDVRLATWAAEERRIECLESSAEPFDCDRQPDG